MPHVACLRCHVSALEAVYGSSGMDGWRAISSHRFCLDNRCICFLWRLEVRDLCHFVLIRIVVIISASSIPSRSKSYLQVVVISDLLVQCLAHLLSADCSDGYFLTYVGAG